MKWAGRKRIGKDEDPYELVAQYGKVIIENDTFQTLADFKQHRISNTMRHCIGVATAAVKTAKFWHIKVDVSSLIRAALLHDFYLYQYTETHTKGHFHHHGEWAAENANRYFGINELERNIISTHMWPIAIWAVPRSREAFLVSISDKIVGTKEMLGCQKLA